MTTESLEGEGGSVSFCSAALTKHPDPNDKTNKASGRKVAWFGMVWVFGLLFQRKIVCGGEGIGQQGSHSNRCRN